MKRLKKTSQSTAVTPLEYNHFLEGVRLISTLLKKQPDNGRLNKDILNSENGLNYTEWNILKDGLKLEVTFSFMNTLRDGKYWALAVSEGEMNEVGVDQELEVGANPIPALNRLLTEYGTESLEEEENSFNDTPYQALKSKIENLSKEADPHTKFDLFQSVKTLPESPQKAELFHLLKSKAYLRRTIKVLSQVQSPVMHSLVGKIIEFQATYTNDKNLQWNYTHKAKVLQDSMKNGRPSIICKDLENGDTYEFYTSGDSFRVVASTKPRYTIKKNEYGEHHVKLFDENNKMVADYFTDDHEDAKDTAEVMMADYFAKKASLVSKQFNTEAADFYKRIQASDDLREELKDQHADTLSAQLLERVLKEHGQNIDEYLNEGGTYSVDDIMDWLGY
jgi:hypothetical protein